MNLQEFTLTLNSDVRVAIRTHVECLGKINSGGFSMEIDSVQDVFFNAIDSNVIDILKLISSLQIEIPLQGKVSIMYKTANGGAASKVLEFWCQTNAVFDPEMKRFTIKFDNPTFT